jgi:rhodanese-related sulfurtransferase
MTTEPSSDAACDLPSVATPLDGRSAPLVPASLAGAAVEGGALLVDTRSDAGRNSSGGLPQAVRADRTRVAEQFGLESPNKLPGVTDHEQSIVVICGSINGSQPVADELLALGFRNVVHVDGGFPAWKAAGLPTTPAEQPAS